MQKRQTLRAINIFLRILIACLSVILVLAAFVLFGTNFDALNALNEQSILFESDIEALSQNGYFGPFVNVRMEQEVSLDSKMANVSVKLFNLFNLRNKKIEISKERSVNISGDILAMIINPKGLIVDSVTNKEAILSNVIQENDIILSIEDKAIEKVEDIQEVLLQAKDKEKIKLNIIREGKCKTIDFLPEAAQNGERKLGLFLRDEFGGIGTLSFIDDNGRFGALGHSISVGKSMPQIDGGQVVLAEFIGVDKPQKGKAGSLLASISQNKDDRIGSIDKNTEVGVFGHLKNKIEKFSLTKAEVGGRFFVKPGKAQILTTIDESGPQLFDVNIVKATKQNKSSTKGIVLRITDKRLKDKIGGIVQGMSGSPILQRGKVVGAITHVYLNDPTMGYGVYLDFMLEK